MINLQYNTGLGDVAQALYHLDHQENKQNNTAIYICKVNLVRIAIFEWNVQTKEPTKSEVVRDFNYSSELSTQKRKYGDVCIICSIASSLSDILGFWSIYMYVCIAAPFVHVWSMHESELNLNKILKEQCAQQIMRITTPFECMQDWCVLAVFDSIPKTNFVHMSTVKWV